MVKSHYPRCLQCFPTQENLTTKTLNPKVTSFVNLSFSLFNLSSKSKQKHLYSTQAQAKSCHDLPKCVTIDAYDPRYDKAYPKNVPNMPKIVSRLLKIVS